MKSHQNLQKKSLRLELLDCFWLFSLTTGQCYVLNLLLFVILYIELSAALEVFWVGYQGYSSEC